MGPGKGYSGGRRMDLQSSHDGGSSITQDSISAKGGAKSYKSGENVHKGGGAKPSKPAPASQPKGQEY